MRVHLTKNNGATDYWRFAWLRHPDQYVLETHPSTTRPSLKLEFVHLNEGQTEELEVYYPLEDEPGLSRRFSDLSDSSGVLAFANAYGPLGFCEVPRLSAYRDEIKKNGEPVSEWLAEAQALQRLYKVLDLLKAGEEKTLKRFIKWSKDGVAAEFGQAQLAIAHGPWNAGWLKKWKSGEVIGPAKLFVVDQFNQNMAQMASPMLLLDAKGVLRPYNAPASLLAALWLEFGQLASGARKQQLCESCGRWMDVTNNHSNKRKHDTCSLREKMARYRHRKRIEDGKPQAR